MRLTLMAGFAAAIALCLTALAPTPEAQARTVKKAKKSEYSRTVARPRPARPVETMDDINANAYDPAGDYRGLPSWARAALSPKDGGGGRP